MCFGKPQPLPAPVPSSPAPQKIQQLPQAPAPPPSAAATTIERADMIRPIQQDAPVPSSRNSFRIPLIQKQ